MEHTNTEIATAGEEVSDDSDDDVPAITNPFAGTVFKMRCVDAKEDAEPPLTPAITNKKRKRKRLWTKGKKPARNNESTEKSSGFAAGKPDIKPVKCEKSQGATSTSFHTPASIGLAVSLDRCDKAMKHVPRVGTRSRRGVEQPMSVEEKNGNVGQSNSYSYDRRLSSSDEEDNTWHGLEWDDEGESLKQSASDGRVLKIIIQRCDEDAVRNGSTLAARVSKKSVTRRSGKKLLTYQKRGYTYRKKTQGMKDAMAAARKLRAKLNPKQKQRVKRKTPKQESDATDRRDNESDGGDSGPPFLGEGMECNTEERKTKAVESAVKNKTGHYEEGIGYVCDTCGATFRRQVTLDNHFKSHLEPGSDEDLESDEDTVEGAKKKDDDKDVEVKPAETKVKIGRPCLFCEGYPNVPDLTQHMKQKHKDNEEVATALKLESKERFLAFKEFRMRAMNLTEYRRRHLCEICGKSFKSRENYKDHLMAHEGKLDYHCEVCGRSFVTKNRLSYHKYTHNKKDTHPCDICGKGFSKLYNLKQHYRCHLGLKLHKCPICLKLFSKRGHQIKHMRIHSGEQPFLCDTCGRAFRDENSLKRHNRLHTGEKPNKCEVCGAAFIQKTSLYLHYKKHPEYSIVKKSELRRVDEEEYRIKMSNLDSLSLRSNSRVKSDAENLTSDPLVKEGSENLKPSSEDISDNNDPAKAEILTYSIEFRPGVSCMPVVDQGNVSTSEEEVTNDKHSIESETQNLTTVVRVPLENNYSQNEETKHPNQTTPVEDISSNEHILKAEKQGLIISTEDVHNNFSIKETQNSPTSKMAADLATP